MGRDGKDKWRDEGGSSEVKPRGKGNVETGRAVIMKKQRGGHLGDTHELGHDAIKVCAAVRDSFRLACVGVVGPQDLIQRFVLHLGFLLSQLHTISKV